MSTTAEAIQTLTHQNEIIREDINRIRGKKQLGVDFCGPEQVDMSPLDHPHAPNDQENILGFKKNKFS